MSMQYEEKKPFIFISYKHDAVDMAVVKRTIQELRDRYKFNIWYDAELTAGINWDDIALKRVRSSFCKMVLFFASEAALTSEPISKELETAKKWRKIIIPINFEKKPFSDVLMQINEKHNEDRPYMVDIAEKIISEHLDDKLTYIVADVDSDDYYNDIYRTVEKNASELINPPDKKDEQLTTQAAYVTQSETASVETAAQPEPTVQPEISAAPAVRSKVPSVPTETSPATKVVSAESGRVGKNGNVLTYTIFGEKKTGIQSAIMYDIFEQAIKRYPEKYYDMLSLHCVADKDYTNGIEPGKTQFRTCKTFYTADGKIFCVGTSYGINEKFKHIAKMMAICGIDRSELVIDGYSLPKM